MKDIRNIGIFAHVDAGKTTLSEQLLAHAGAIRIKGSVDRGTAHTDTLPVERRRGISVKATCVSFDYDSAQINLIDTPGHVDFSAEIERSLWALDGAILTVCAVEGVQPQTEVLFSAMKEQGIPVMMFINKTDRIGADVNGVMGQISRLLSKDAVLLNDKEALCEKVCDKDEEMMLRYLEGEEISEAEVLLKAAELTKKAEIFPVLFGSALKDEGVIPLLDAVIKFFPSPESHNELCGVVFSAGQDKALGRGVWVRLFGGTLTNRDAITLPVGKDPLTGEERFVQHKISQICLSDGVPVGKLSSGEIGIVYGLGNTPIGQILGEGKWLPRRVEPGRLRTPLITVQAIPSSPEKMTALREACEILSGEDPLLLAKYVRSLNELHLQVMGTVQLEILEELLKTRFDLDVTFSQPAIIYKETVSKKCKGYVAYTMPKPCWAVLDFEIEPGERGSGVTFSSTVPVKDIMACYQHQVEQALPLALSQGRLGWQVTDIKIKLVGGGHHLMHTHPLDFIVATPMGIQDGLKNGGSTLLEPILDIRFMVPAEFTGRIISDVATMRGEVVSSFADGERVVINALVPVSSSLDYSITLATATGGRGTMSVKLHGYKECPLELGATAKRRNVDPLDTAKYILTVRGAMTGDLFDM